jgi:hypothetical protein
MAKRNPWSHSVDRRLQQPGIRPQQVRHEISVPTFGRFHLEKSLVTGWRFLSAGAKAISS